MARKSYNEGCLAAHALDLIGDRWAILVLRELMLGPKRFSTIKSGLPGIATNVLTQRLEGLEAGGLLERRDLPPPSLGHIYALTAAGDGTRGILDALCRWGMRQPGYDPRKFISPTALMFSLFTFYIPAPKRLHAGFVMGDESFVAEAGPHGLTASVGAAEGDIILKGTGNEMSAVIYGRKPLETMVADGRIQASGDLAVGQALIDRFTLKA
ncbi:winged helix-turn-helix transcriptional regulator [Pararhodobacter zhoushanensis]|uniref:Helix-turn-helix transcriptional regulator n=1 Tax=Pararhodobacter zhoushanensis TaxID=2479545 RepID=A0ABT3GZ44_9RHOB|nr:helix-turn-helix domain-containing protein [Pararhodobacter zhoushanensis]MCW1932802.1 helix-turn-helix transcriptional regulator [Pararhodobacter zhoushanensis]